MLTPSLCQSSLSNLLLLLHCSGDGGHSSTSIPSPYMASHAWPPNLCALPLFYVSPAHQMYNSSCAALVMEVTAVLAHPPEEDFACPPNFWPRAPFLHMLRANVDRQGAAEFKAPEKFSTYVVWCVLQRLEANFLASGIMLCH